MWTAYFQFDGDMRYTIAVKKLKHQAVFEAEQFVERMTNPSVGIWWTWVEDECGTVTQLHSFGLE